MVELAIRQKIVRFYELDGNLIEVGTPAYPSIFLCCSFSTNSASMLILKLWAIDEMEVIISRLLSLLVISLVMEPSNLITSNTLY